VGLLCLYNGYTNRKINYPLPVGERREVRGIIK